MAIPPERRRLLYKAKHDALRALRRRHEAEYQALLVVAQEARGLDVDQSMRRRWLGDEADVPRAGAETA